MPKKNIYKNIHDNYIKIILEVVKETFPEVRKRKYSLEYYLDKFIIVYSKLSKWQDLDSHYDSKLPENHWNTINNEFRKWCKYNIFETAYKRLLTLGYYKLPYIKKSKTMNLFIDVTKINNKLGSENVGVNCEYKKKNITALQFIVDEYKIPLGVMPLELNNIKNTEYKNNNKNKKNNTKRNTKKKTKKSETKKSETKKSETKKNTIKETNKEKKLNDKQIKYKKIYENNKVITKKITEEVIKIEDYESDSENMQNIIYVNETPENETPKNNTPVQNLTTIKNIVKRSTLQHEIKNVQNTLNSIDFRLKPYHKITLVGDKGYISKENFTVLGKELHIITPKKRNDKTKQNKKELTLLKKRHIIENYFANLKTTTKINQRKERKTVNYMGLVYLDLFMYFSKILGRNKINI
jgi:hypothetical protein